MPKRTTARKHLDDRIKSELKDGPEQQMVVGPLVQRLIDNGWSLDQIRFGRKEYLVPKSPSEAAKREKDKRFDGFPVDIAVFDAPATCGDYRALVMLIECKREDETSGLEQIDIYLGREPHVRLGIWANSADPSAQAVFLFRDENGKTHPQKRNVAALPKPGARIDKDYKALRGQDLIVPSQDSLSKVFSDMLDRVVARDTRVTRREEQLDQICNIILLKLHSDKAAKLAPSDEVNFKASATTHATASGMRSSFERLMHTYPDVFLVENSETLRLNDDSIAECVDDLAPLNLLGVGPEVVSVAFQILRSAALKQEEGQYFTPLPVVRAAVKALDLGHDDLILDPACGTGGFLVECMVVKRERVLAAGGDPGEVARWAAKALHGIDKDAIAIKLTKAIMQIMGDGAANCARGDSILTHKWPTEFSHLQTLFRNGRFSTIFTNPPFGAPLKVKRAEAMKAGLSIAEPHPKGDIELGLAMLSRCHELLRVGGRLCIVLPETYFFSPKYKFVREWCRSRFVPELVINVPMDAFQGFCRAKTNVYIFRKVSGPKEVLQDGSVFMLNPRTCGTYKNGAKRYKVTREGVRTDDIDDEMLDHVTLRKQGRFPPGCYMVPLKETIEKDVLVPTYYDHRYDLSFEALIENKRWDEKSIAELIRKKWITIRGGHGSPSNDLRVGSVPYVKVSDVRAGRINVNPTNMIPRPLATKRYWRGEASGIREWDLLTPNRASSNIGEFAILLPGEQDIVLTKEVFVISITEAGRKLMDPFFLQWALSLKAVRDQWRRITLMQTNREDVGNRHLEIRIPWAPEGTDVLAWTTEQSVPFRAYFSGIASAKQAFTASLRGDDVSYIGSVLADSAVPIDPMEAAQEEAETDVVLEDEETVDDTEDDDE